MISLSHNANIQKCRVKIAVREQFSRVRSSNNIVDESLQPKTKKETTEPMAPQSALSFIVCNIRDNA